MTSTVAYEFMLSAIPVSENSARGVRGIAEFADVAEPVAYQPAVKPASLRSRLGNILRSSVTFRLY